MGIEYFKRWHWVILGAIAGIAMGYAWCALEAGNPEGRRGDKTRFETEIQLKDPKTNLPLIKNITIYPPEVAFDGKSVNTVTWDRLAEDKQGRTAWIRKSMTVENPYKPVYGSADPNMTFRDYLKQLASQNNSLKYRDAWWLVPRNGMLLGAVAGMIVIGGVWPSLLNLMIGAGLGRKYDPKAAEEKRPSWYGKSSTKSKTSEPAKPRVSAEDEQRMRDLTANYEKSLAGAGMAVTSGVGGNEAAGSASGGVRKLEGGPLQQVTPLKRPEDDDDIEVKGEYYPVLIHHKKQHESDKKESPPKSDQTDKSKESA